MSATWSEIKRRANLLKHGLDFAEFDASFDGETALYLPTYPSERGRTRYLLIGDWNGTLVVAVVVSHLGTQAFDIVSLRPANPKERAAYDRYRSKS